MFTVRMQTVAGSVRDLQQSVSRLDRQIDEVQEILLRLRNIPEYDEVRSVMKKCLEDMRSEKHQTVELLETLSEIWRIYDLAEYHITDYGRQLQRISRKESMKIRNLGRD